VWVVLSGGYKVSLCFPFLPSGTLLGLLVGAWSLIYLLIFFRSLKRRKRRAAWIGKRGTGEREERG